MNLKITQEPDIVTRDVFPERREHPNLNDQFVRLSAMQSMSTRKSSAIILSNSHVRTTRLLSEVSLLRPRDFQDSTNTINQMRNILVNPNPQYEVYVSESDIGFWKVVMQGVSYNDSLSLDSLINAY